MNEKLLFILKIFDKNNLLTFRLLLKCLKLFIYSSILKNAKIKFIPTIDQSSNMPVEN